MADAEPFSEDDLLAYAQGKASPALAGEIERAMASNPGLKAEVSTTLALREALAAQDVGNAPGAFGWRRLEAEIRRETKQAAPAETRRPFALWRAAAVFLGLAVLGQGAYIAATLTPQDRAGFRTATENETAHVLVVGFADSADVATVEALLRVTGGRVIDGPGALGIYRVAFDTQAALQEARLRYDGESAVDLVADQ